MTPLKIIRNRFNVVVPPNSNGYANVECRGNVVYSSITVYTATYYKTEKKHIFDEDRDDVMLQANIICDALNAHYFPKKKKKVGVNP